jgi:hypothetical protein
MEHYIKFTPQIDESADVAGFAQLLIFVSCCSEENLQEAFTFYLYIEGTE